MDPRPGCSLADHFGGLDDPRVDRAKRHVLLDIVTIAVCAVVCGADSWVEVEAFGKAKRGWLSTFLDLPHGTPSHDTLGRVFAALDPEQFRAGFLGWARAVAGATAGRAVAIDGKTLRRSHDRANGKAALHLVSAWAGSARLVLGQVAVDGKSNEITAIPALLDLLLLKGCIVTIDAMGCQTAIAARIVAQEADYVLAVKDNQPTLHREVRELFAHARATGFAGLAHDHHRTVEKDHGRLEIRRCWTISEPEHLAYLNQGGAWPNLRSIGMVDGARRSGGTTTRETRYFISSLTGDAAAFGAAVRGHWGIENGLHWVLDVAFREDECRVRAGHSAQNFAVLRHLALNLLQREPTAKVGVKAKRLKAGWDDAYLLQVLAG